MSEGTPYLHPWERAGATGTDALAQAAQVEADQNEAANARAEDAFAAISDADEAEIAATTSYESVPEEDDDGERWQADAENDAEMVKLLRSRDEKGRRINPGAEDAEEGEEGEEAEAPEAESKISEDTTFAVKVNGEELQVPLSELLKGYSRHSDYTRKTQEVAAERAATEQLASIHADAVEALAEQLEILHSVIPQEVRDHAASTWSQLQQQRAALSEQQQATTMREAAEQLAILVPEWKDAEKSKADRLAAAQFLMKDYGATPEELGALTDPRIVVLAHKARLYDALKGQIGDLREKGKGLVATKSKNRTLKPGARGSSTGRATSAQANLRQAQERLHRTGRESDAVRVLEALID
jgi:hypothetical protein